MYKCSECGRFFDEPNEVRTSYESYYGVSNLFPNSTPFVYGTCPHCNSESYEECHENAYYVEELLKDIKKLDGYNEDYDFTDEVSDFECGRLEYEDALEGAKEVIKYYENMHLE